MCWLFLHGKIFNFHYVDNIIERLMSCLCIGNVAMYSTSLKKIDLYQIYIYIFYTLNYLLINFKWVVYELQSF